MEKLILLSFLCSSLLLSAQEQGAITYEQVTQLKIELEGEMAAIMKDLPTENKSQFVLYRSGNEIIYKNLEESDNEDVHIAQEGDIQMDFRIQMPENILYVDLENNETVEQKEFLGKKFLIKGNVKDHQWKLTGKSKMVLDYPCQQAILQDTSQQVTAWFAPTIPWQLGPQDFHGLPGLILELEMADTDRVIKATNISMEPIEQKLEKPKKGKAVTQDEFEKIRDEKMKEMGATKSGNTAVKMIIRSN
jgi:GLPGLI family protein